MLNPRQYHASNFATFSATEVLINEKLGRKPYEADTLYLFCGRKTDHIKGLVWEMDGYLLLCKRLNQGNFQ